MDIVFSGCFPTHILENTRSYTVLEKCSLEEKLEMRQMRCEELHEEIVGMGEMIRIIIRQKSGVEEKLEISNRKCEEMDERILKMGREIEELRQKKSDADQIEELMWNEIKTLRRQKLGVEKKLESSIRKCEEMEERLLNIEREKFDAEELKLNIVESGSCSLQNGMVNVEGDAISPTFQAACDNSGGGGGIGLSNKVLTASTWEDSAIKGVAVLKMEMKKKMMAGNSTTYTEPNENVDYIPLEEKKRNARHEDDRELKRKTMEEKKETESKSNMSNLNLEDELKKTTKKMKKTKKLTDILNIS